MVWFPITDPSRAADIRMRRKRALMLLGLVVCVPWLLWGNHAEHAANHRRVRLTISDLPEPPVPPVPPVPPEPPAPPTGAQSQRFTAASLTIDLPCADSVSIQEDDSLDGQTVLSASQSTLDAISVRNGTLTEGRGCSDDSGVVIRTGRTTPLTLVQSGDNDLHVGRFDGAVSLVVDGSGDVRIDHAGALTVRGNKSGDVSVGSVSGPVTAIMTGSGDLGIDGGTIPVLDATLRGSAGLNLGSVAILGGRIAAVGSGDISLASARDAFEADLSGSGDMTIKSVDLQHLELRAYGSGDVTIGTGRIAVMNAVRYGSGDLSIAAEIGSGLFDHRGNGDVDIPHRGALQSHN
ncbi:DUF2807 domain-containing protein [Acetobacteraceae bacterium KSS8]|uniref:DUF2807 domain-containing protein n=1 Tax=Endosaccharibacter trunci TaxID=2812733 RepID=A0ABT1W3F0_9PROT|nr:DUF2807 domain-containing protein [Acetobacteraceae bacterium KSS8]